MSTKRSVWILVICLLLQLAGRAAGAAPAGKVDLPLKDYLSLVETVARVERERAEELARRETPVAEVVSQRVSVVVGVTPEDREAAIVADFEVLLQGKNLKPVLLPVAGFPESIEIRDETGLSGTSAGTAAAAVDPAAGGVLLAATKPGRYKVHVTGRAALGAGSGTGRLSLGTVAAPVASTEIDLPADLAWSSPGAVLVEEKEQAGRRHVRLATARGESTVLDVRRKVDSAEAEKLLAESVVLTIFQLRPDGLKRHDIVLYEVRRGSLGHFTVALPPGLEIDQAGTDEDTVVPVVEGGHLTVYRRHQLRGVGYLVLTSTPPDLQSLPAAGISLDAVTPEFEVRARYLAVSLAVAADVKPLPAASWARVDTSDLPAMLSSALTSLDLAAAWRLSASPSENSTGARLAVAAVPAAPILGVSIRRRDTTTLLTVDGTLLYRDSFVVDSRSRSGAALDMTLPAGARLWSAKVDNQPVRPLDRNGVISVPLGFDGGMRAEVEVVSVLEKALPPGRSQLAFDLPQVTAPVLLHRLRLLLPAGAQYRFHGGDLRFTRDSNIPRSRDPWAILQSTPGVLTDRINVGGNESGQQSAYAGPGGLAGGYANLYATVMDQEGNLLPGATVTLRKEDRQLTQNADAQGRVSVTGVADGSYSMHVRLEGFSDLEYPNVVLNNGRNTTIDVNLEPAVEDVITVAAESPILDERRISTGATVTQKELEKIPTSQDFDAFQELQQGLVGGVKPLPVSIPETGKSFTFSGVLPPARIRLEMDVKVP